jgi:hypothetical protein
MVEPARDGRKILEPDAGVSRSLGEDLLSLFLRQVPPVLRFRDGDERSARRLWPSEGLLAAVPRGPPEPGGTSEQDRDFRSVRVFDRCGLRDQVFLFWTVVRSF